MSRNTKFEFQGLDHVVLVSSDMAATVDFYHRKLGMPVLHTHEYFDEETGKLNGQHFFFGVGDPTNHNAHIAFFWFRNGAQLLPKVVKPKAPPGTAWFASPVGSMMHLNLRVAPEKLRDHAAKLKAEGISYRHATRYFDPANPAVMRGITTYDEYHEPDVDGLLMNSIYFHDPDGYYIEFNCWTAAWDNWPNNHVPTNDALAEGR